MLETLRCRRRPRIILVVFCSIGMLAESLQIHKFRNLQRRAKQPIDLKEKCLLRVMNSGVGARKDSLTQLPGCSTVEITRKSNAHSNCRIALSVA